MKYEDWIKYEQLRKNQSGYLGWVTLPPQPESTPCPETKYPELEDGTRVWTIIVQIFNSRRI